MSAVSMPIPITRANRRTVRSITGRVIEMLQARLLNLPDLMPDQPSPLDVATQLSQRIRRYWLVLGRAQIVKAPGGPFQLGIEAADAEPDQRCFHSVDDPALLANKVLALAVGPLGLFVLY